MAKTSPDDYDEYVCEYQVTIRNGNDKHSKVQGVTALLFDPSCKVTLSSVVGLDSLGTIVQK